MTQEEKAKAYDEALERARQIKDGKDEWRYSDLAEITPALTEIFPELRESEDERIRKALVWHLKADVDFVSNGVTKAECLSWLEKQKEQMPDVNACKARARFIHNILSGNDMKKMVELYNDEIPEGTNAVWAVIYPHNPKEQKPADVSNLRDWKFIVDAVLTEHEGIGQYLDKPETERIAKKLQERFSLPQSKPAEWSEEDKEAIEMCIDAIPKRWKTKSGILLTEWLKEHLRPSWKPSEEQMEALNYAIAEWDGGKRLEGLYSLRNDLKKL